MDTKKSVALYTVEENVICLNCGNKGAVKYYGDYYPNGVGDLADELEVLKEVKNKPYMSRAMGFGGTIPHKCLNCGNIGLIDTDGLEGIQQGFRSIKKPFIVLERGKKEKEQGEKNNE